MPRLKKLYVGALNVTTHPHSQQSYIELFNHAFQSNLKEKIHGASWGTIGTLRDQVFNEQSVLFGTIYRYLNIDPAAAWLDTMRREPMEPDEDGFEPPVPSHLKPHLRYISYLFLPEYHRLFFDLHEITARSMQKFLQNMFNLQDIMDRFGEIDVSIESSREAISRILSIPRITRLEIHFNRPNDDDLSELEQRVVDRINSQNIRKLRQTSTTTDQDGIEADEETKALMNVARSNGKVIGAGFTGSEKIVHSTEDHPMVEQIEYNPGTEDRLNVMLQVAAVMIGRIRAR